MNCRETLIFFLVSQSIYAAQSIVIPMTLFDDNGQGKNIGTVTVKQARCGLLLTPNLSNLPPGIHGFHIHDKPSCDDKGMAAGAHYDPNQTDKHRGPYQLHGHEGDLPILVVDEAGMSTLPVFAPKLTLADVKGHALMIHAGQDNYSDQPEKLGGGGARIACGVISRN